MQDIDLLVKGLIITINGYEKIHDEVASQNLIEVAGWIRADILRCEKELRKIMNLYVKGEINLDSDLASQAHDLLK